MHPYQRELLESSLAAREREIIEYQVNIDNFRLAIKQVEDADLQEFKTQLQTLLASSLLEQKKTQIMQTVIQYQLDNAL
jgi:hypothetical protein